MSLAEALAECLRLPEKTKSVIVNSATRKELMMMLGFASQPPAGALKFKGMLVMVDEHVPEGRIWPA